MDRAKVTLEGTEKMPKEYKSWVATRFSLIEEAGVAKRLCKFVNCGKEYSRGTSHMILKRHWSKAHFDDPPVSLRPNHNKGRSQGDSTHRPVKKKPLNTSNLSVKNKTSSYISPNNADTRPSNNGKVQLDVKLVAKRLKEATSIHLTFDVHTPKKGGKSYGIITAHSLSESLDIKSVLLEYKHLPYPDDSTTINEFLKCCITKFNIREKIVSLASNSSDAVVNSVQELDKKFRLSKNFNFTTIHIQCFPQFVHLNVIEVLRSQETHIDNVRKIVAFINNNNFNLRPTQLNNSNDPSGKVENSIHSVDNDATVDSVIRTNSTKLPFDNRSSWNTTYNMIETLIQQRAFVEQSLSCFQNLPHELANIDIDWDRLYTIRQLLKPFHEVITKFAIDNYAPVSLVAVFIPHLMDHLSSPSWEYDDLALAAHNFKSQLESYRQLFQSDLTVIAGLLDPRIKDTFISPEGRNDAIDILRKRLNSTPPIKVETLIHHKYRDDSILSQIFRPSNPDEISDYLESPRMHGLTNVICYWEAYKNVYPSLYVIAKALVCVQATSVPSDRMFSAAENAERERKVQLESTNSKELMRSWAKYLEK